MFENGCETHEFKTFNELLTEKNDRENGVGQT